MNRAQREILVKGGAQHAHRRVVLTHHPGRIVIDIAGKQGIADPRSDSPSWNIQASLDLCRGDLAEVIVPFVMV